MNHAFHCVHLIPIIDTHFKSYLNNPNKGIRNKWLIFCLVDATFLVMFGYCE